MERSHCGTYILMSSPRLIKFTFFRVMAGAPSSFQRKSGPAPGVRGFGALPGVNPSLHSNQLLTSTGTPHLDTLLGGGLPLGSLLILQEDSGGSYGKLLVRYFLSEGLVNNQALLAVQGGGREMLSALPSIEEKGEEGRKGKEDEEKMKIAWRYQGQTNTKGESSTGAIRGHVFNLLKTVSKEVVENADTSSINLEDIDSSEKGWKGSKYCALLNSIKARLSQGFMLEGKEVPPSKVLRIGVSSLGEIGWGKREDVSDHLSTFLLGLRALLRSSLSVAVISLPSHLHTSNLISERLALCSDFVVELESFDETEAKVNTAYKDYHGLVRVLKLPSLGTLCPPPHLSTLSGELVFKSRRTQFVIEKFCLPPDLGEKVSRDTKASATKVDIDF